MKKRTPIRRILHRCTVYLLLCVTLAVFYLGAWCVPPKMFERIIQHLKSKYLTELVQEEADDDNGFA